jgi:hypothetical protein
VLSLVKKRPKLLQLVFEISVMVLLSKLFPLQIFKYFTEKLANKSAFFWG